MKTFSVTEPWLDIKCGLSEGPYLEHDENVLRFVDIMNNMVYRVDLDKGPSSLQRIEYENSVSVTADIEGSSDTFLYGGKYGIGVTSKDGTKTRVLHRYWNAKETAEGKPEQTRANDGAVDSQGRFWVSAVSDPLVKNFEPEGILFRLDLDGSFKRIVSPVTIGNGISWTKDDKTMYFTETQDKAIYTYDYDAQSGDISNKKRFFSVEEEGTGPDGHAMDEDGNIWAAIFGQWKVVRISPEGEVTAEVKLPVRCPTAVVFVGEDIYITSAEEAEPHKYPEGVEHGGSVFKCHVGIQGKPTTRAKLQV